VVGGWLLMSLKPRPFGEIPEMTVRVARATFRKGTLCVRIRDELGPVFDDEQFVGLFGDRGRPGWSPARLVWVSVLQFVEGLTDRQAAEAVRSRIDWKYLLGLELDDPGFDHTVLSEFRDRLIAGEAQRLLLDTLLVRLVEAGLVKGGGRARTDSTHVLAAVRVLNRVENVFTTMQNALEQIAETVPGWLGSWLPPTWQALYGKPLKMPKTDTGRVELGHRIGADGHRLWAAITSPDAPTGLVDLPMVQVLRQVWVQQFHRDSDGSLRWRSKDPGGDGQPPASIRIDTPFDLDARRGVKRGMGWTGYKDHYTETCGDPNHPNVIIDADTTLGPVHDSLTLPGIHDRLTARTLAPAEHLVDSGYAHPEAILTARTQHNIMLVTPLQADSSWQATAGEGFDQASFTIDWDQRQVICPTGATSRSWRQRQDTVGPRIHVAFSNTDCRPCPSRPHCIRDTASSRSRPRHLTLHTQTEHNILHTNRRDQTTQDWKTRYATRAGVEGTMSQAVAHGARHARYTGLAKQHLQTILTAIGLNLLRIHAWLTGTPHATTRTSRITKLPLTTAA
jgi:transposase